jgi:hypothetical protein
LISFAVDVDYVSGQATYRHLKEEPEELEAGMTLVTGDIIETGMNSEVILLDGDSEIVIAERTRFTISEKYVDDQRKSTLMLFLGKIGFKLGKSAATEPDIQTQTVNLTIRGTEFEVGSGYDGSTIVLIRNGSVAVQGRTRELLLEKGEGTEVKFGEEPTKKFEVMTRVIDWDTWLAGSQRNLVGNETVVLERISLRLEEINLEIIEYEGIRENALREKDRYFMLRDELLEAGKNEEASDVSKKAGVESKRAFHSIVNIRFLALSSIGLFDMAERIYTGIEAPTAEQDLLFTEIKKIYSAIEDKYVLEGDRERLEEQAAQKKGCFNLF